MGISEVNGASASPPPGEHGVHTTGMPAPSGFSAVLQGSMQAYATPSANLAPSSAGAVGASARQIPMQGNHPHGDDYHIHELALKFRAYRMELLASNIANADTPGYKARDIDVEQALRDKVTKIADIAIGYVHPQQSSLDANTVEMDTERVKFAENALKYQFSLDRAAGHYRHMMELLQSLKD